VPVRRTRTGSTCREKSINQLLSDAAHSLNVIRRTFIAKAIEARHEPGGRHPAEKTVALDEQGTGSGAGGGEGGYDTTWSPADHHHIPFGYNGQFFGRFTNRFHPSPSTTVTLDLLRYFYVIMTHID